MWLCRLLLAALLQLALSTDSDSEEAIEKPTRWFREILRDTDAALTSILKEPVDQDRVDIAFQFVLGYKGLLEKLIHAARSRDPRTIEVFRDLENGGGRPMFVRVLPDLSVRQKELKWTDENLDIFRTQIIEIYDNLEMFKKSVIKLLQN